VRGALGTLAGWRAALLGAGWEPTEIAFLEAVGGAEESAARWAHLGDEVRAEHDRDERFYDEPWPPPRGHQPQHLSTAATSTSPGSVALATDDWLKNVSPREYVEALTGEPVPASGWLRCPLPDHDDERPSFQVLFCSDAGDEHARGRGRPRLGARPRFQSEPLPEPDHVDLHGVDRRSWRLVPPAAAALERHREGMGPRRARFE
jgi:hypothetical protein